MKRLVFKKTSALRRSLLSAVLVASLGSALALETNEDLTILQGLQEDENFTTLVSLLESSGLSEDLSAAGDFTLFAPTNEAFDALAPEQLNTLSDDSAALTEVLQLHVMQGEYPVLDLNKAEEGTLSSLSGESYVIEQSAGGLMVNDADLVSTDVDNFYSNGVIHVVSNVLVPASMAMDDAATDVNGDGVIDDADTMTDMNGDGVIDEADMTDTNGDGVIDEQDAVTAEATDDTTTTTTDTSTTDTAATPTTTEQDTTATTTDGATDFSGYDTNADGQVDSAEFQAGLEVGSQFSRFDSDGNGDISQEEFNQGFFALLDTDGDGSLSESEWSAASFMLGDSSTTMTQ